MRRTKKSHKRIPGRCRVCGCTDDDCSQCVEATGEACFWVEPDLCSRCFIEAAAKNLLHKDEILSIEKIERWIADKTARMHKDQARTLLAIIARLTTTMARDHLHKSMTSARK